MNYLLYFIICFLGCCFVVSLFGRFDFYFVSLIKFDYSLVGCVAVFRFCTRTRHQVKKRALDSNASTELIFMKCVSARRMATCARLSTMRRLIGVRRRATHHRIQQIVLSVAAATADDFGAIVAYRRTLLLPPAFAIARRHSHSMSTDACRACDAEYDAAHRCGQR